MRAYDILTDVEQRTTYDELLAIALQPPATTKSTRTLRARRANLPPTRWRRRSFRGCWSRATRCSDISRTRPAPRKSSPTGDRRRNAPGLRRGAARRRPAEPKRRASARRSEGRRRAIAIVDGCPDTKAARRQADRPSRSRLTGLHAATIWRSSTIRSLCGRLPRSRHHPVSGVAKFDRAFDSMAQVKRIADSSRPRISAPASRKASPCGSPSRCRSLQRRLAPEPDRRDTRRSAAALTPG